jgi:hypothetical protein
MAGIHLYVRGPHQHRISALLSADCHELLSLSSILPLGVALPFRKFFTKCLQGLSAARNRQSIGRQYVDKLARQSSQVEPASRMPMNKDDSRSVQNCLA